MTRESSLASLSITQHSYSTTLLTNLYSALEGNNAPERWIRDAISSGFDVTRKTVIEARVRGDRDEQVVPASELLQLEVVFEGMARLEVFRSYFAGIGIKDGDVGWTTREIRDSQFNRAAVFSPIVF